MKIAKRVLCIIFLSILAIILFINIVILVNSYTKPDEVPSFFGWKPFIVLSGSMETQIHVGDLVIVKETDTKELNKNDIIAFREDNIVITHRIVDVYNDSDGIKYITKGDNNNAEDKGCVTEGQVEGVFKCRIGGLGNLALFIQTPIGIIVSLSIPLIILLSIQYVNLKKEKQYYNEKIEKEKNMQAEIESLKKQNEELKKEKISK